MHSHIPINIVPIIIFSISSCSKILDDQCSTEDVEKKFDDVLYSSVQTPIKIITSKMTSISHINDILASVRATYGD